MAGKVLDALSSVALLVASLGVLWVVVWPRLSPRGRAANATAAVEKLGDDTVRISMRGIPEIGSEKALVGFVEFSDFECPFCQRYAKNTFQAIRERFVDTGRIRYGYLHTPLSAIHPRALAAAGAAECAGEQGQFWNMYQRLFGAPGQLTDDDFRSYASSMGLDLSRFLECSQWVSPRIQQAVDARKGFNVRSTPTFMVGTIANGTLVVQRRISGAQPEKVFLSTIDEVLDEASPKTTTSVASGRSRQGA